MKIYEGIFLISTHNYQSEIYGHSNGVMLLSLNIGPNKQTKKATKNNKKKTKKKNNKQTKQTNNIFLIGVMFIISA
jgi:hypothetical protein